MTKYIDADKIRAEIERRVKEYDAIIESQPDSNRAERDAWKWAECKSLLSFLDTLQEPEDRKQEPEVDLEKEIDLWISENENIHHGDKLMVWLLKDVAHYFAEWQKSEMLKDNPVILSAEDFQALLDSHAKRVEQDYKEKMLKEAVEVMVEDWNPEHHPEITIPLNPDMFTAGDRLRIVILPKKEE